MHNEAESELDIRIVLYIYLRNRPNGPAASLFFHGNLLPDVITYAIIGR